ncbi:cell adhesion molecule CEACAM3-like [Paramisgurnus dabryanus]|uniref:cell adhesion molecule CEACAM3-like n=1 Tax=Paramisgurnus dabryanus TaxID=90735 RepID=UPI0031F3DE77
MSRGCCCVLLLALVAVVSGVDVKAAVGDEVRFNPDIKSSLKDSSITWKYTAGGEVMKVIEWDNDFKTLESLIPKFKTRVALDRTTGELTIRNLQLEHTGLYTIEINNKELYKRFTLTVKGVDMKTDVDIKAVVGGEVRFKPDIPEGSLKDRSITWIYKAGGDVINVIEWDNDFQTLESLNPKFKTRVALDRNNGELTITDLQLEDTGLYTIEINNKEQEKQITLTVVDVDIKAVVGGEVRFKPDIPEGSLKDASITWIYKTATDLIKVIEWDNDFQTEESLNPKFKTRVALDRTTGELTIRDLQLEDTGLYTIKINYKEQEKKFTLTVMDMDIKAVVGGEVHFKPDIPEGTSLKDRSITWRYKTATDMLKVIEWDRDFLTEESLNPKFKTRVALDRTTGELTIRDLQLEHTGLYTFEINNKEQEKKFTLTVVETSST